MARTKARTKAGAKQKPASRTKGHTARTARRRSSTKPALRSRAAASGKRQHKPAAKAPPRKQTFVASHHSPDAFEIGLRRYAQYRDLGIAAATGGQVICHLVKANPDLPPEEGTGWHRHDCDFQIVIMMKGWARFMYEDKPTLVQAGDVVHQRPGIVHYLFDYSPDMEYLEIVSPADFKTVDMPPVVDNVPPVTPWK